MREITYAKAISEAFAEEMERDPTVFILGEDIAQQWKGVFGAFFAARAQMDPASCGTPTRQRPQSNKAVSQPPEV